MPVKKHIKAAYCHLAYLTYMQSTSCKMLGWMKHKLESRPPGEIGRNINNLRYADGTTLMAESEELKNRDWGQEKKGTTEDEMAGWHH